MTDDASEIDPALPADVEARLRAALGPEAMPPEVWTRLERALHREAADRAPAGGTAEVVPMRRRRPMLAGLLGAAAAVVAVAVLVPTVVQRNAEEAAPVAAPKMNAGSASAMALMAAPPMDAAPMDAASMGADMPARQVIASGRSYSAGDMTQDIAALVDSVGAGHARLLSSVSQEPTPTEGASGFTATLDGVTACVQALTASTERQALVIDRATFNGKDAAIVIVPSAIDPSAPMTQIDVWVVGPDCSTAHASVVWHGTMPLS